MEDSVDYFNMKPGDVLAGKKIKQIYASGENFIIYRAKWTKPLSLQLQGIDIACLNPAAPLFTEITGLLTKIGNSSKYNDQIATAYVQCIMLHPQNAINILVKIKALIEKDIVQQSKINYLFCTILILLFNTTITLTLFYTKDYFNTGPFREYFTVATFGSYGGFISILYKINKLNFDEEGDKKLLFFLAVSRSFISMLSSIIVCVLIKSNVILGILNNVDNVYVFYIFSVVAGFSETFVPDLLAKIEKSATEKS